MKLPRWSAPRPWRRVAVAIALPALLVASPAVPAANGLPSVIRDGARVPSLAPIVGTASAAVVNIRVTTTVARPNPLADNPAFRRFFNLPDGERSDQRPSQSAGSGVVIDARRGFVVTNHHVVDKADSITVILKDRRVFDASLIGSDPGTDIALLRIQPDRLSQLRFADSDQLEVGDFTVAIGNPFGLGQTVTSGIVSALGRSGLSAEGYEDFIQTDASINPGNSGGALIDLNGRLIGVNSAIIGPTGGNVGIGFAVPSNMVGAVVAQLIDFGEVRRGRLGVIISDVTPEIAEALRLDTLRGAVISRIEPGSPADRAGLARGDVVLSVDGQEVAGSSELRARVGLVRAGQSVELRVLRDGRERSVTTRVERPGGASAAAPPPGVRPELAGARLRDLEPGDAWYTRARGVLIERVAGDSPAWRNGLRAGDLLVAVNRQAVSNVAAMRDALEATTRSLALRVRRGRETLYIVIN